jgi:hypothetical protein
MLALLMLLPLLAQSVGQSAAPDIPRTPDGKPDLNGVWERPYVPDMSRSGANQQGPGKLPFTPWGEDDFKSYDVTQFDYTGHCLPQGLTRSMNSPFPIEIFQTAKRVAVLYEAWNVFHVIPTDGRGFPKNVEPTWMGTSIGKWDGDTLVVDTIGFNGKTRLDTVGHPLTEQLHVTEGYTRADSKHLAYEVVVDDPKAYSTPWKNVRIFTLRPDWEIMEYSCEENNRDLTQGHIK